MITFELWDGIIVIIVDIADDVVGVVSKDGFPFVFDIVRVIVLIGLFSFILSFLS